jgi:kynurenine formamidase
MPRFIDVSHVIEAGMVTYPGLPVPEVEVIVDHDTSRERYQGRSEFLIASLHACGNTGTYVDSPLHRHRGATDLAGLALERLAHVPVRLFDATSLGRAVGPGLFEGTELRGCAVIVRTDFSQHWRTDRYGRDNPFLTADACEALVKAGAAFVGIDSLNIDDIGDLSRPAHTILLRAGIPICEHMTNLAALPRSGGHLHAVPIPWKGGATFPVRAYVQL